MLSKRIYIIGAGEAGQIIAREIKSKGVVGRVIAYLDDDRQKIGKRIDAIPVLGPINDVVQLLDKSPSDEALIAMPSTSHERLRVLYQQLELAGFRRIRIVPTSSQMIGNGVHLALTREINPQDLLGRNPVQIDLQQSIQYLKGKRVLITGAGGSIGSVLASQLLYAGVSRLFLLGHGENSIYQIDRELRLLQSERIGEKTMLVPIIGELQDRRYVEHIVSKIQADVIFHTAAHKHVTLTESNPIAAIMNNVMVTRYLAEASQKCGVERFTLFSTDKAAQPTSIYGATKRLAEDITLSNGGVVVRFGNVLGSRGSIMPLFQYQIENGGPVTITDPQAKRFFMTIPEAAALVIHVSGFASGGQLYILEMGEQLSIQEIAEQMIRFYGYTPHKQIDIEYIGLREGEKEIESLLGEGEYVEPTQFRGIQQVKRDSIDSTRLASHIAKLDHLCGRDQTCTYSDKSHIRRVLQEYSPTLKRQASLLGTVELA